MTAKKYVALYNWGDVGVQGTLEEIAAQLLARNCGGDLRANDFQFYELGKKVWVSASTVAVTKLSVDGES